MAGWRSGYAVDCKSTHGGSIPSPASIIRRGFAVVDMHEDDGHRESIYDHLSGEAPYEVRKINKRLVLVDANDKIIYAMPFWVQVTNRMDMQWLADRFNEIAGYNIDAIIEFETKHSTVRKRNAKKMRSGGGIGYRG